MKITSSAFLDKGIIPSIYTCEGKNTSPPLEFSNIPPNTQSLVLIMDDPDVPKYLRGDGMYDHWILFNIPPETKKIEQGAKPPGIQGCNTNGDNGYIGPCPPDREHRYFFKLYALDTSLYLEKGASKKEVEIAMKNHILAKSELMGRYEKKKGY